MALRKPNVLIYLLARTAERESQFHWVGELLRNDYAFYRLRARRDIVVGTLAEAEHYAVGVTREDVRHQYLRGKGFRRLVVSGHAAEGFRKLLSGQVQLLPLTPGEAAYYCKAAGIDPAQLERVLPLEELATELYMAYSLGTPEDVVRQTRAAFERLKMRNRLQSP